MKMTISVMIGVLFLFASLSLGGTTVETNEYQFTSDVKFNAVIQTNGGWDDLIFSASSLAIVSSADIALVPVSNAVSFAITCTTNLSNGDHVWASMQMPHAWVTNSAISPHIHFIQENSDHTNMWFLRYKWYDLGAQVPTTWTELNTSSNLLAYTSGPVHQIAEFPDIVLVRGLSSLIDIKIYRKGTVGTGVVLLKQFDIHFQKNSFGSDQEYTKRF